ncbi:MAG: phage head closure protein [Turicibacter sp.]|nr:phage head closure protein [Turicibacter sp.]
MYQIKASELRQRISIVDRVKQFDDAGSLTEDWQKGIGFKVMHTVYAKIVPIGARDYFEAMSNQMQVTHRIVVRYLPGINHKMLIKFKGRKLEIVRVINIDEKNKWLEIQAVESM